MTKANANAAANAQEQQAAQQQILRDLLALGKKNGRLTLKEISDALSHLELSSEDIDKVYETLETMGIEVETNGVLEKVIGDDDDSFEPEEVEEVPEEELVDTSAMAETFAIDDPVRMYLKEIGKVDLLSPEEEVTLAERMQKGNEAAERIANEGDAIPAEERAQLEKDIKLGALLRRNGIAFVCGEPATGCLHCKALCRPRYAVPRSDSGGQPRSDQGS